SGADDADTESGEIDPFMRPFAGVIDRALEILAAFERDMVGRREAAYRHDAEFGRHAVAAIGRDAPAFVALVEGRRGNARVEQDMPAQVEAVGDVIGVAQNLRLRRVLLRPIPLLVELFGERERILHAFDVATRAGIAVPVPGAAD